MRRLFLVGAVFIGCFPVADAETVRGMLTENGVPAPNVRVAALGSDRQPLLPPTFTNRDGLYFLRGVDRGEAHALRVWIDTERSVDFPIVASVKPSVDLPPLEIRGAAESQNEREITRAEIEEFLRRYYNLYEQGNVKQLVLMYGDFVDYYDSGVRDRAFIAKDKGDYVRYITKRQFRVKGVKVFDTLVRSEKGVRFTFSFLVGPLKRRMSGPRDSTEVWTIRRIAGNMQIVRCRSDRMGS